jgi:hypothetical protein
MDRKTFDNLNAMFGQARRQAIATRRMSILTVAQHERRQAQTYRAMGLYNVAAQHTMKAARAEYQARELTRASREVTI